MSAQFDHFYAHESEQFAFFRIPKMLFTDPRFQNLSVEAKLLYGMILDRMELSRRNGWMDGCGRVYIYFTHTEIQRELQCGHNKAVRLLKELDQGCGLIQRKRQGLGRPDRIYVMNFVSNPAQSSQYGNSEQPGDDEIPEESIPYQDIQNSDNGNSVPETSFFETSAPPDFGVQDCPKEDANNTYMSNTDMSDTESIYPINLEETLKQAMDEMDAKENLLKNKWGYIALLDKYPAAELDGLVSMATDVLCSRRLTTRIGGQEVSTDRVVQRFLALDHTHIDYVLECFHKTKKPVHNIRSYLLTTLYQAPTTIDAYVEKLYQQHEGSYQQE